MIKLFKYILLGIIQGFTEPIPISSSGHLVIIKNLFKLDNLNDINFEIIVNFGSFIAVLFFYRKEIINILKDFFMYLKTKNTKYKDNYNYLWLIIIGTIPAGLFGLILKDKIDLLSNNIKLIGIALLITSIALYLIHDFKGIKNKKDITIKDAFIIGLFQVIALFPGISRSGATITGGMFRNLKKEEALKYSFMLYMPISIATIILGLKDFVNKANINSFILPYFLGMIASFIFTYFSLKWFIKIIKKGKLIYFSVYCLIIGLLVILFM